MPRRRLCPTPAILLALVLGACGGEAPAERATPPDPTPGRARPRLSGRGSAVTPTPRSVPPAAEARASPPVDLAEAIGPVRVRVVDDAGRPLAGADVSHPTCRLHAPQRRYVTDADGWTALPSYSTGHGLPSQDRRARTLTVRAAGYATVTHLGGCSPYGYELVRLLDPGLTVAGRVVDSSGTPVPDAVVRITVDLRDGATLVVGSDADGAFVVQEAPAAPCTVRVRGGGRLSRAVRVVPPQTDLDLVAYRPATLRGRITVPPGKLLPRPTALTTDCGAHDYASADLEFAFCCVPGEVVVRRHGEEVARFHLEEGERREDAAIVLARRTSSPRKVDQSRRLVLDLRAWAAGEILVRGLGPDADPAHIDYVPGGQATEIRLPALRPESLLLSRTRSSCVRVPLDRGASRVAVQEAPAASVSLRLRDGNGRWIEDGWVGLRWARTRAGAQSARRPDASPWSRADAAGWDPGAWRVPGMGAGRYDVVWYSDHLDGAVLVRRDVVMPDPPENLHLGVLVVPPPLDLQVEVVDADACFVPRAVVRTLVKRGAAATRTDENGRAVLRVRDPVRLGIEASTDDGRTARIEVPPSRQADLLRVVLR